MMTKSEFTEKKLKRKWIYWEKTEEKMKNYKHKAMNRMSK
jgi:hypothetical protein